MSSPGPPPGRGEDKKEKKSGAKKKGSGKKKGSKKRARSKSDDERSKKDGSTTDDGGASGAKDDEEGGKKPKSAGQTIRDAAQRVLNLAVKSEWTAVEGVLKSIEKGVALAGEEAHLVPMAGVLDPVSTHLSIFYFYSM